MVNHRVFTKKIYCGNCGRWIMKLRLETKERAHMQRMDMVYNCEPCSTPGTGKCEIGMHDIYAKYERNGVNTDAQALKMMQSITSRQ